MSTKFRYFLIIAILMLLCIGLVCWLYVDGSRLPLPEADYLTGYATRLDIGFDEASGSATHNTVNFDMTDEQISSFLHLLRTSSYRRTRYGSSVSFDGDVAYSISLTYRLEDRNEIVLISILDNELLNVLVNSNISSGYLKIIDPEFLTKLQSILEN